MRELRQSKLRILLASNLCTYLLVILILISISLIPMLQSINFLSCDEKVSVIYHDPVFPENKLSVFDSLPSSGPSFCGKEISVQKPVDISYDDITTQYKVVFTPDQKGNWKKASFLFDFTTSMLQAQTQFFKYVFITAVQLMA